MDNDPGCNCEAGEMMIFPCAGACNVGQLANDLAKDLSNKSMGKMACIAAVGAGGVMAINAAKKTKVLLVLDGCPVGCAKKIMEKNGLETTVQVLMTDIGMKKTDVLSYSEEEYSKARKMTLDKLQTLPR
ncbi:MAG: DGC domain protein [Methanomassiliicoccales archaeon PtaU1.Bin124]|nr:MAG: DGC domain protein [Methanomassiliicoccales archaeon PtaU1.Bin124]